MPGKLSTIYDNFGALLATALPTYNRVPNPYAPETTTQLLLERAYGLAVGAGQGAETERPSAGRQRTLNVVFINKISAMQHDGPARQTAEKAMLEDMMAVEMALELDNTLSGSCFKVDYSSDSGVRYLVGADENRYLAVDINFTVLYQESTL